MVPLELVHRSTSLVILKLKRKLPNPHLAVSPFQQVFYILSEQESKTSLLTLLVHSFLLAPRLNAYVFPGRDDTHMSYKYLLHSSRHLPL
nr:hypothetical protein CFP56_75186 [Quercus suber]